MAFGYSQAPAPGPAWLAPEPGPASGPKGSAALPALLRLPVSTQLPGQGHRASASAGNSVHVQIAGTKERRDKVMMSIGATHDLDSAAVRRVTSAKTPTPKSEGTPCNRGGGLPWISELPGMVGQQVLFSLGAGETAQLSSCTIAHAALAELDAGHCSLLADGRLLCVLSSRQPQARLRVELGPTAVKVRCDGPVGARVDVFTRTQTRRMPSAVCRRNTSATSASAAAAATSSTNTLPPSPPPPPDGVDVRVIAGRGRSLVAMEACMERGGRTTLTRPMRRGGFTEGATILAELPQVAVSAPSFPKYPCSCVPGPVGHQEYQEYTSVIGLLPWCLLRANGARPFARLPTRARVRGTAQGATLRLSVGDRMPLLGTFYNARGMLIIVYNAHRAGG